MYNSTGSRRASGSPTAAAPVRQPTAVDPAIRAVAAIGLITVGIIHALEIPGQISGTPWLTVGFCMLAVVAPAAGLWLLAWPSASSWEFGGLVCVAAQAGYILTRSIPVPGDTGDVGNWLEPLGVVALITQGIVIVLAAIVLCTVYRPERTSQQEAS